MAELKTEIGSEASSPELTASVLDRSVLPISEPCIRPLPNSMRVRRKRLRNSR